MGGNVVEGSQLSLYCNSLHCFTLFFTLSPDFGKRIFGKRFFENRLFRKRLWKTDSSLTKNGPAHNRAGPFRWFQESYILSWNIYATSRFTIACKVKVIAKKVSVQLFHFLIFLFVIHLLFRASTLKSLNSFAKVTLFFDTAKQIVSFFFIFLIFSAFQHIFSIFLSEKARNWQIFISIRIISKEHLPAFPDNYRQYSPFIGNALCLQP